MEEPEQDIREKLAGESPTRSSRGAVAEGSGEGCGYCRRRGPVMKRATGPRVLSQDQLYKRKQQPAVSGTGAKGAS